MGTKVERNDYTGVEWSPSIRLAWYVSSDAILWGAVSRAVRIPSRIDRDISQPSRDNPLILLVGGEDFWSETMLSYELGYRLQTTASLMFSAALFFNEYDHIRSTSLTPGSIIPFYFENNVEGGTNGLELALNYQATDWLQFQSGYSFLDSDLTVKKGEFDLNNARNETADPRHQVFLRSANTLGSTVEVDMAARWVDELPYNNVGDVTYVSDYTELDIRLTWHATDKATISLVGRNLLHDHHQEFGLPGPF